MATMSRAKRFEEVLLPHLDAAYNLARWITRDDHDAEDVVQEAFMRALRYFDSLKGLQARGWILGIVRNTAYTWLEKNRPAEIVTVEDQDLGDIAAAQESFVPDGNPEVIALRTANARLVNQAIEAMPLPYREVLVMREIEDMSYREIAEVANLPIGTVMSRLSRARELLRGAIEARMRKAS
jgi:RNA polymerase sigma-70 factor (ECF subfamily)